ncbi:MAG: flagellar protein [Bradyrhizobium sp.]|uniref:flagellar protein n=1 Tax=Bradyrhizobium sp. TaxID=376 RepID=UPI001C2A2536|nr:flagellar protein [Bradyrhizobium sp.]MBU6461490.1 flagellar protein [Pseudomonadota bacterium]MDE2066295.1 flagellar protein [Bradyrhizobium sp.]MDE2242443.1 flagellar protein [Bradyrhizobium sp.]
MSITSIGYATSPLGQAITSLNNQMTTLSQQLATGEKSNNYAGMGVNEGFAIAARSQLASISAFTDTISNVSTSIQSANNALQAISNLGGQVQSSAASTPQTLDSTGQTIAQENANAELSSMIGILNTPSGDRYLFSGNAINTPATVPVDEMLNGTATQAGLKTLIAQRAQADGAVPGGTGRLVITNPPATPPATSTVVSVAEDAAGSPFGLKLNQVTSSLTGATVTGPSGSPAAISIDLGATNPSPGDQISFTFNQPDGTTASVQLTATTTSPPPTGSFLIGSTPAATAANLTTALNTAIGTVANTTLVAASAIEAGDNFFNTASVATGNTPVTNQAVPPTAITAATALSGSTGTDSLAPGFTAGDTITVNGTTLTFVNGTAGSGQISTTATVGDLLSAIDSITGTSTPSTIDGGVVEIHTDDASSFSITTSPSGALAGLGFSGSSITAPVPPLRVSGSPLSSATSLVAGTSANTVQWYTGNSGPGSARASSTARVDSAITVQYGAQANESAIRSQLQSIAVFAAFTASPTGANSAAQISALSQRIATDLTPQPGQQTIADIQSDFARAQTVMQDTSARQAQSQIMLQTMVDNTETVSTQQVASEILALQTALQASYQTTSMMSQLTLTKYLPIG